MKPVRNLGQELVERRLWPVVLVLVAALVAIPLVLGKGEPATPPPPPTPQADVPALAPPASATLVTATVGSGRGLDALPRHNPFKQHTVTQPAAASAALPGPGLATATGGSSAGSGSGGSGTGATAGGGSSGSSSGSSAPATSTTTVSSGSPVSAPRHTPTPAKPKTYRTVDIGVTFGRVDRARKRRTLPPLAPLPSATHPIAIFLGVVAHTRTAAFIVSSDEHAEGDGRCLPSATKCRTVLLKAGQTEFLDVTQASGAVVQYRLDLVRVRFHTTRSKAAATGAFVHVGKPSKKTARRRLRPRVARASQDGAVRGATTFGALDGVGSSVEGSGADALSARSLLDHLRAP